jgi:aerobic carbon-monoxide dehydrogenase small subunit
MLLSFRLNGRQVSVDVDPRDRLLDVLRASFGLFGVKLGCGEGECGSCTVLIDDLPAAACLVFAGQVDGADVRTAEGLEDRTARALKDAFIERGAVQCGFCTPGMLVAAHQLLGTNKHPTEDEIRVALSGNLCRCTGYVKIIAAVRDAALRIAAPEGTPDE